MYADAPLAPPSAFRQQWNGMMIATTRSVSVGIFPNENSVQRLVGAILLEQNDDWQLQHRYLTLETMAEVTAAPETKINTLPQAKET